MTAARAGERYREAHTVLEVRAQYAKPKPGAPPKHRAGPAELARWRGWPRYNDTNVESDSGLTVLSSYLLRLEKDLQVDAL